MVSVPLKPIVDEGLQDLLVLASAVAHLVDDDLEKVVPMVVSDDIVNKIGGDPAA